MRHTNSRHPVRGFSLVELMVGMAIGMVAVIVIMQVFSVSEGYKRSTMGGDDAQNNGAIAIYGVQRDLRQAGYGFNAFNVIGCNVTLRTGVTVNALGPITINHPSIPAGDANTDTLLVFYGSGNDSPEGDHIETQMFQTTYTLTGLTTASGTPSVAANDRVIAQAATRPSPCALTMETVSSVANSSVTVPTGVAGMANGALFNLGPTPRVLAYAVRGGNLTVCDYMVSNCGASTLNLADWVPVASNIVSLRAQYGRDTASGAMDGIVDAYDQTTPATACGWLRARAVRLALVARGVKESVTSAAPIWAGSSTTPINLSANSDWQRYRYKTFETTVPMRNMAWMGVQAGC
jgi:type IV pilus assembly protein PilW